MPRGHPQQIRATTDLKSTNMAKLSLILSADRMSIAHTHLESYLIKTFIFKDTNTLSGWEDRKLEKTSNSTAARAQTWLDVHTRKCVADIG